MTLSSAMTGQPANAVTRRRPAASSTAHGCSKHVTLSLWLRATEMRPMASLPDSPALPSSRISASGATAAIASSARASLLASLPTFTLNAEKPRCKKRLTLAAIWLGSAMGIVMSV